MGLGASAPPDLEMYYGSDILKLPIDKLKYIELVAPSHALLLSPPPPHFPGCVYAPDPTYFDSFSYLHFLSLLPFLPSLCLPPRCKWQLIRAIQMFTEHVIMKHTDCDIVPFGRQLQAVSYFIECSTCVSELRVQLYSNPCMYILCRIWERSQTSYCVRQSTK